MKRSIKIIVALIVVAGIAVGGFFLWRHLNRTLYNDGLVYGNSAGNFYNGGLFCEIGDYVYFSNPFDQSKLYRMTLDGQEAEKLTDDTACFINVDPHYIYYARDGQSDNSSNFSFLQFNTNSLCRITLDGGKEKILDSAPALFVSLIGNDLYYIHYDEKTASTLYKVGIDGKDSHIISREPLRLSPGLNGTLCYAGVSEHHNIALWNPETDRGTVIYEGTCYLPIDTANAIYFLDATEDYTLARYDKAGGQVTKLTQCRVDCYNLTSQYIYYQKNDGENSALCRIPLDGSSGEEIVKMGTFTSIHTTSRSVYFSSFHNPEQVFETPADGPVMVEAFDVEYK